MTQHNRIAICEAGVRRCFIHRHSGRYAFMLHADAMRHCHAWIRALREARAAVSATSTTGEQHANQA